MKKLYFLFALASAVLLPLNSFGAGSGSQSDRGMAALAFEYFDQTPVEIEPVERTAVLSFEKMNHEFGTLVYKSKSVTVDFPFTNTGNAPLVFIRSEVSCSCITVKLPRTPVEPGESGVVKVTYSPKNEIGLFNNSIKIFTNASDRRLILFVKGEVIKK